MRRDRFANFFIHGGADRFVEVALGRAEFDGVNEDGFGREFFGDLIFGAAKNERGEAGAEEIAAFVVLFFFDGSLVELAESVKRAEEAGNEKAEERQSSPRLFSMGVPERQRRWRALSWQAACETLAEGFLMCCASSRMAMAKSCFLSSSMSRCSKAKEVMTISAWGMWEKTRLRCGP